MGTLETFLRKEKVLTKFKANTNKQKVKGSVKRTIDEFCIDTAFIWNETPEGLDFWSKLCKKYQKELNENK